MTRRDGGPAWRGADHEVTRLALTASQPGFKLGAVGEVPLWDRGPAGPPGEPGLVEGGSAMVSSDERVSFETDVKPLFRESDREAMKWSFDLWSYGDVKTNAEAILERLAAGTMPCDGPWPTQQVAIFRRWVEARKPE